MGLINSIKELEVVHSKYNEIINNIIKEYDNPLKILPGTEIWVRNNQNDWRRRSFVAYLEHANYSTNRPWVVSNDEWGVSAYEEAHLSEE